MDRGAWQATVHGTPKELEMIEHAHTPSPKLLPEVIYIHEK